MSKKIASDAVTENKISDGAVSATKASVASQAEAEAGTDTTKLMTPERTAQAISAQVASPIFTESFESSAKTPAVATKYTEAHGLSSRPKLMQVVAKCTTAEYGWNIGDEVVIMSGVSRSSSGNAYGMGYWSDATNCIVQTGALAWAESVDLNGDTRPLTIANWEFYMRAWA